MRTTLAVSLICFISHLSGDSQAKADGNAHVCTTANQFSLKFLAADSTVLWWLALLPPSKEGLGSISSGEGLHMCNLHVLPVCLGFQSVPSLHLMG